VIEPCDECDRAAVRLHHGFALSCERCKARALARSPQFHQALTGGSNGTYKAWLQRLQLRHADVLSAARSDLVCAPLLPRLPKPAPTGRAVELELMF
jgi:hypothetical protein